jgi:hypothetical protein
MSEPFQRPPRPQQKIRIGAALEVHSLKSARGSVLNGKRSVAVKRTVEDRWEMQIEGEQITTALKADNLRFHKYPENEQHPIYMDMFEKAISNIPSVWINAIESIARLGGLPTMTILLHSEPGNSSSF